MTICPKCETILREVNLIMMKKLSIIALAICMLLTFVSCQTVPGQTDDEKMNAKDNENDDYMRRYVELAEANGYQYPEYSDDFTSNMTAVVTDVTDCGMVDVGIEYHINDSSAYSATPENLTATLSWFGTTYTGTYVRSKSGGYNNHPVFEYCTDDGRLTFRYGPEGNLIFVGVAGLSYDDSDRCEESLIRQKADAFLSQYVDASSYVVEISYDDASASYSVQYTKYWNTIPTTDGARLVYTAGGELAFYSATLLGQISVDTVPPMDLDEVLYTVYQRMEPIYQPIAENYEVFFYEAPACLLTQLSDGSYALYVKAGVQAYHDTGLGEIAVENSGVTFMIR